ncbi:MAG: hypothetical protein ACM32O_04325 [Clostridia bacterium]
MVGENNSVTKCSLTKKAGEQFVDIKITNESQENPITLKMKATDQDSEALLNIYIDGNQSENVTIEPSSSKVIQVDLSNVKNLYELELSNDSSGGGMSIKQSSSSNKQGKKHLVEVVLR